MKAWFNLWMGGNAPSSTPFRLALQLDAGAQGFIFGA
jgi:hypothetical protein